MEIQSDKRIRQISKLLSLVLRHKPEKIGLTLDPQGWVAVAELLAALQHNGTPLSRPQLENVVAQNDKKRFAFSEDGLRIRASQGHSVPIELGYEAQEPPEWLYHGTVDRFLDAIRSEGLTKQKRHHVHLSADLATAEKVGGRRGKPVILKVRALEMHQQGHQFLRSENGVWLVEHVPAGFLAFPPNYEGNS